MKIYKFTEQSTNAFCYVIIIVAENEEIAMGKFLQKRFELDLKQTPVCMRIGIEYGQKWKIESFNTNEVTVLLL